VTSAQEILPTGDFKTLLKDAATGRALVAKFTDDVQARPGFLFAFVPGASTERLIEPDLAAILVRTALQAAGSGEPFSVQHVADLEMRRNSALPQDWKADVATMGDAGAGVLDEKVSALAVNHSGAATAVQSLDVSALKAVDQGQSLDLRPLLIVVGLICMALELSFGSSGRGWLQRANNSA
jgi:hypothetical protein